MLSDPIPADASSVHFQLVELLEKNKVETVQIDGDWVLKRINGKPLPKNELPKEISLNIN